MATTTSYLASRRVYEATFTLVFGDTTAAAMFSLPSGARIIDYIFNVKTAFVTGTTTVSLGTSSTSTELVLSQSVAAVGKSTLTTALVLPGHETTAVTDIYAVVGASNTAGEVDITVLFSLDRDTRK